MLKVKFLSLLLWLWFPLALGPVDGLYSIDILGISLQQGLILACYLCAIVVWVAAIDKNRVNFLIIAWLLFVMLSVVFSGVNSNKIIQFLALCGAVAWSLLLIRMCELKVLISKLDYIAKFLVVISVLYIFAFPSHATGYVNDSFAIDSFYGQKNIYGRFLFFGAILHLINSRWVHDFSLGGKFTYWSWLAFYCTLLIFSSSKSAMALFALSSVVLFFISTASDLKSFRQLCVASLYSVLVILIAFYFTGFLRFEGIGSALDCVVVSDRWCVPGTGRYTIWFSAIGDVFANGMQYFGYGYGVYFTEKASLNLSGIGLGEFIPNDPHNGYVDTFISFGYAGVLMLMLTLWRAGAGILNLNKDEFVFFFVFLFAYVVSNFSESYFIKSTNVYPVFFFYLLNYIVSIRASDARGRLVVKHAVI